MLEKTRDRQTRFPEEGTRCGSQYQTPRTGYRYWFCRAIHVITPRCGDGMAEPARDSVWPGVVVQKFAPSIGERSDAVLRTAMHRRAKRRRSSRLWRVRRANF